jgi:hypothetical protein
MTWQAGHHSVKMNLNPGLPGISYITWDSRSHARLMFIRGMLRPRLCRIYKRILYGVWHSRQDIGIYIVYHKHVTNPHAFLYPTWFQSRALIMSIGRSPLTHIQTAPPPTRPHPHIQPVEDHEGSTLLHHRR